jgi:hypothetical protein
MHHRYEEERHEEKKAGGEDTLGVRGCFMHFGEQRCADGYGGGRCRFG